VDNSPSAPEGRRVALVTGSGRGIGRAIALRLARQGRSIVVGDILDEDGQETVAMIGAQGGQAMYRHLDVTNSESVAAGVGAALERFGAIDILVNNAGWDEHIAFLQTEETFWHKVFELNYVGMLRTTRAIAPAMVERGWGRIINIGSDAGRVGSSLEAVYSGAKGGVIGFSKALAREVARKGVTVNIVCPGPTQTPLLQHMIDTSPDAERIIASMTKAVPMRRLAKPEDIAVGVAFFASEDAGYVTGQTLSISGGLTMA
jgi:2-hydroxycyclohexanecarboxyl-CoA dehydrogenase